MRPAARSLVILALIVAGACRQRAASPGPSDRPWTLEDFQRVAKTRGCGGVPRFGSPAFARMTDATVLAAIAPPDRPLAESLPALIDYQEAVRPIFHRYATVCSEPRAVLAIGTAMLESMVRLLPMMEQFMAGFSPDDPSYATRVGGLEQTKQGVVGMATGAALTVRGTDFEQPVPGVGLRLGAALARLQTMLPPGALAAALGNLDVPADGDDNPHRRALREEIRSGLHAPPPAP